MSVEEEKEIDIKVENDNRNQDLRPLFSSSSDGKRQVVEQYYREGGTCKDFVARHNLSTSVFSQAKSRYDKQQTAKENEKREKEYREAQEKMKEQQPKAFAENNKVTALLGHAITTPSSAIGGSSSDDALFGGSSCYDMNVRLDNLSKKLFEIRNEMNPRLMILEAMNKVFSESAKPSNSAGSTAISTGTSGDGAGASTTTATKNPSSYTPSPEFDKLTKEIESFWRILHHASQTTDTSATSSTNGNSTQPTTTTSWDSLIVRSQYQGLAHRLIHEVDWSWSIDLPIRQVELIPVYQLFILCKVIAEDFVTEDNPEPQNFQLSPPVMVSLIWASHRKAPASYYSMHKILGLVGVPGGKDRYICNVYDDKNGNIEEYRIKRLKAVKDYMIFLCPTLAEPPPSDCINELPDKPYPTIYNPSATYSDLSREIESYNKVLKHVIASVSTEGSSSALNHGPSWESLMIRPQYKPLLHKLLYEVDWTWKEKIYFEYYPFVPLYQLFIFCKLIAEDFADNSFPGRKQLGQPYWIRRVWEAHMDFPFQYFTMHSTLGLTHPVGGGLDKIIDPLDEEVSKVDADMIQRLHTLKEYMLFLCPKLADGVGDSESGKKRSRSDEESTEIEKDSDDQISKKPLIDLSKLDDPSTAQTFADIIKQSLTKVTSEAIANIRSSIPKEITLHIEEKPIPAEIDFAPHTYSTRHTFTVRQNQGLSFQLSLFESKRRAPFCHMYEFFYNDKKIFGDSPEELGLKDGDVITAWLPHMKLNAVDESGQRRMLIPIRRDQYMLQIKYTFATKFRQNSKQLSMKWNGEYIGDFATPKNIEVKDGDEILIVPKPSKKR